MRSWWELAFLPSAELLILFCTGVGLTVSNLDGNRRRRNCCKAPPHTSLLFCRGFPWHQTELFRTCSCSNLHPRFYKTLKKCLWQDFNAVSLLPYKNGDITTAWDSKKKKYIFSSWKYPGKQLLGPLTLQLKIFEQSFSTSPSVVLLIWENKAKIRSLWLRHCLGTVS